MNKKIYQWMSIIIALILAFGGYYSAQALSITAPLMSANTYYVSTTGNDANIGTFESPFKTISKAVNAAQPGYFIYVRAGTYASFTVAKSGTSASPITIAGYQNETPKIDGGIGIRLTNVSYVIVRGFEVTNASGSGVLRMGGVVISGGENNTIEYCKIHDNLIDSPNGIKIENSSNNHINHNTVYNNGGASGGVGIRIIGSVSSSMSTNNEIGWNTVYGNTLAGSNADGIGLLDNVGNTYIHDNLVYGNGDDGIDTWNTSRNIVAGNISFGHTGPGDGNGFKLGGGVTGGYNTIKQNIAYGNKLNGFDSNGSGGNVFYNNIAYNNLNFGFEDGWKDAACTPSSCQGMFINNIGYNNVRGNFSASAYTAVSHNNLWYSDSGSTKVFYNYTVYSSLSAFYLASGSRLDNPLGGELASLQSNPLFTDASGGIFTVHLSSPVIDKGDAANPGQVIAVNRVDIGVFENTSNPTPATFAPTQTPMATFTPTYTQALPTQTMMLPTMTPTMWILTVSPTFTPSVAFPTSNTQATIQPVSETIYDDMNASFVYSSGWKNVSNQQAYGGSYKVASTKGASATLGFTGQSFSIFYTSGPNYRSMEVYVDGVLAGTIDQKTSLNQYQQRWDYPNQLTLGAHTLKLVTKNRNNTYNSIDQIIVR